MSWDTPYRVLLYLSWSTSLERALLFDYSFCVKSRKAWRSVRNYLSLPFCHCLDSASVLQSLDANARDLAPTTALIAASAAAATYLDAKFHISKDIGTISLNWRAERHYARAGTLSVMCSERGPRSMSLRDWCATSQIQPTFNLLFLRRHCKGSLRCAGHLVTICSVHLARDLCTGLPICGILP